MKHASAAQWAKRVKRWQDSGLTAKEFAAKIGCNASTLSGWKWRLGTGAKDRGKLGKRRKKQADKLESTAKRPSTKGRARAVEPAFVEVPMMVSGSPEALELVLDGHVRVRVPSGFDEATLMRVVRAVEAAR